MPALRKEHCTSIFRARKTYYQEIRQLDTTRMKYIETLIDKGIWQALAMDEDEFLNFSFDLFTDALK